MIAKTKTKAKAVRVKKPLKSKAVKKTISKKNPKKLKDKPIGIITHYFPKVRAAAIKLKAPLSLGDNIRIKGHTTDFIQKVESIQIDKVTIKSAKKGQEAGLQVSSRVRRRDKVYKVGDVKI